MTTSFVWMLSLMNWNELLVNVRSWRSICLYESRVDISRGPVSFLSFS